MSFSENDIVSGMGIQIGRYQGTEEINSVAYHKIFDVNRKATCFIPNHNMCDIRRLPKKTTVEKNLTMFDTLDLIDSGEVEGSRYKYFKEKMEKTTFKGYLEVLHDLSSLKVSKEISSSERKLMNEIKEKMLVELCFILDTEAKDLEDLINFKKPSTIQ